MDTIDLNAIAQRNAEAVIDFVKLSFANPDTDPDPSTAEAFMTKVVAGMKDNSVLVGEVKRLREQRQRIRDISDTAWIDDWILRDTSTGDFTAKGDKAFASDFEPADQITAFVWNEIITEHFADGAVTVLIPFDNGGDWPGEVVLDLDQARVLRDMLNGALGETNHA